MSEESQQTFQAHKHLTVDKRLFDESQQTFQSHKYLTVEKRRCLTLNSKAHSYPLLIHTEQNS